MNKKRSKSGPLGYFLGGPVPSPGPRKAVGGPRGPSGRGPLSTPPVGSAPRRPGSGVGSVGRPAARRTPAGAALSGRAASTPAPRPSNVPSPRRPLAPGPSQTRPGSRPRSLLGQGESMIGKSMDRLNGMGRSRFAEGGRVVGATQIEGTNCANCLYAAPPMEPVSPDELNEQGGVKIEGQAELKRAEKADLITLPGGGSPEIKFSCGHSSVNLPVNERMCCVYWDAPGTFRPWETS